MKYEQVADRFVDAIIALAEKPENLTTLGAYLASHFGEWMHYHASTPDALTEELEYFASMEI